MDHSFFIRSTYPNRIWSLVLFFIAIEVLFSTDSISQIGYSGSQYGTAIKSSEIPFLQVNSDPSNNKEKGNHNGMLKIDYFAETVKLDVSPQADGKWFNITENTDICLFGLTSPEAHSLGITFEPFHLLYGSKVFIYTPGGKEVSGAFTFRNNSTTGVLATGSLPGDTIIVEIQSPAGNRDLGKLTIASLSIGFSEEEPILQKDEWFGRSADCHVDINCINDAFVQEQKYSVCRLIIERTDGRVRCTGTLLNNTAQNAHPYVLTASHCITEMYDAHRTIVYFDYESPYCRGGDGVIKSVSGSFLKSRSNSLDFALIELEDKIPVDYYPLYSGWNASGEVFTGSYAIHHPEGDVKKYASDSDGIETGTFLNYDEDSHWLIRDYENGTTERGSSGGALFDKNNRVVGTLSGGGTECLTPIYDFYQKFSAAWDSYNNPSEQLKVWLDPQNTGVLVLDELDPYMGITEDLSNIRDENQASLISVENGWGYISGHNSMLYKQYAEHFYRNGSKYIYAVNMNVAKAEPGDFNSFIRLQIWNGNELPQQVLFEKTIYLFELEAGKPNLIRLDTLIYVNRNFFIGYEINYSTPQDTFALFTEFRQPQEDNTAFVWDGQNWLHLNDGGRFYDASLTLSPLVLDYYPPLNSEYGVYPFAEVTIYPVPTYDNLQILLKTKPEGIVTLSFYDLMGKLICMKEISEPEPNFQIQTSDIQGQGVFLLRIEYDGMTAVKKFIRLE